MSELSTPRCLPEFDQRGSMFKGYRDPRELQVLQLPPVFS
jgi:hypothetical protein